MSNIILVIIIFFSSNLYANQVQTYPQEKFQMFSHMKHLKLTRHMLQRQILDLEEKEHSLEKSCDNPPKNLKVEILGANKSLINDFLNKKNSKPNHYCQVLKHTEFLISQKKILSSEIDRLISKFA